MTTNHIQIHRDGPVLELIINRPETKNALTLAMYESLVKGLEEADQNDAIRVVLIRGAGGNFTSGNDLKDFMQDPPMDQSSPVFRFLTALLGARKPILAAVDGFAIGIGTTMLLHCDLVYATTTARFQLPFINLAVVPEAASSLLLPRMMGHQRAAELLFFGDGFGSEKAQELGFLNGIVAPEELEAAVRTRALKLAEKPPAALLETKKLLKRAPTDEIAEAMRFEAAIFAERLGSPEFAEAVSAFFEKRKPNFD
ncbi:MAG: enoyl-CoA hydratase [Bradymonadaceae bacterium]